MSRILVTGSQGTLGIPLVRELRANGHEVWGMDLAHHEDEYEIRGDVREARQVDAVCAATQPELVMHLAAEFGRINGSLYPEMLWSTNCLGTSNIIRACISHNAHMVMASSSEAYGDGADLPGLLHEDRMLTHVPRFANDYALTKWTNEKQVETARLHYGLRATVIRTFNCYGPGEHYSPYRSVVCQFIYKMLHSQPVTVYQGGQRDFLYVDDWARTVARIADRTTQLEGEHINIGGEDFCSIERLAALIADKTGYDLTLDVRPPERSNVQVKRPAIDRAQSLLDHVCKVNLDEGLERTIKWQEETYGK